MINEVITGISQKLDAEFNGIDIYINQIKQGIGLPCFFIMLLAPSQMQIVGDRYYREQSFDVHYFSKTDNAFELNKVSDELMNALEYIVVDDGLLRGTKMHSEVVDGVLHFFVNYNAFTIKEKPKDKYMQQLKVKERVKV